MFRCVNSICCLLLALSLLCFIGVSVKAQPVSVERPEFRLSDYDQLMKESPRLTEASLTQMKDYQQLFPDSAIDIYKKWVDAGMQQGKGLVLVRVLLQLGDLYTGLGRYEEAFETLHLAKDVSANTDDGRYIPYVYNHISHVYQIWGDYERAILYMYRALLLNEQNPVLDRSFLYNNLAIILMDIGADESAWYYLDVGEQFARKHNNYEYIASILMHKGSILYKQEQWDEAIKLYLEADTLAFQNRNYPLRFSILSCLARVRLKQKRYEEAFDYIRLAQSYQDYVSPLAYNTFLSLTGAAYLIVGQTDQAEHYLQMAKQKAEEGRIASDMLSTYLNLSELYARKGRYQEAFDLQKKYTQLNDSLKARETTVNVSRLELMYRTAQKDKEIAYKELLLSRLQNNIRMVWAISLAVISVLVVLFIYTRRLHKARIDSLKQEEKLKSLQAFIQGEEAERRKIASELHDGVGGLLSTSIMYLEDLPSKYSILSQSDDFAEVKNIVSEALDDIRKTAHSLMPELVMRYGLQEAIRLYCDKVQGSGKLHVDFQCFGFDERLPDAVELAVYRIVQELIQNVTKHAQATRLLVQISAHHGLLAVTVEDDGKGIPEPMKKGMGLETIYARVAEMNGQFFITRIQPHGTNAYLELDLQQIKSKEYGN